MRALADYRWKISEPQVYWNLPGLAEARKKQLAAELAKVSAQLASLKDTFEQGAAAHDSKAAASLNRRMAKQRLIGEQAYVRYCAWNQQVWPGGSADRGHASVFPSRLGSSCADGHVTYTKSLVRHVMDDGNDRQRLDCKHSAAERNLPSKLDLSRSWGADGLDRPTRNPTVALRRCTLAAHSNTRVGGPTVPQRATLIEFGLGSAAGTAQIAEVEADDLRARAKEEVDRLATEMDRFKRWVDARDDELEKSIRRTERAIQMGTHAALLVDVPAIDACQCMAGASLSRAPVPRVFPSTRCPGRTGNLSTRERTESVGFNRLLQ